MIPEIPWGLHDFAMRARAPPLDLITVWVFLVCIVNDEEKIATHVAPPVSDKRIVRLSMLIDVNDNIPILAFSLHDASAFRGFGAAQRNLQRGRYQQTKQ